MPRISEASSPQPTSSPHVLEGRVRRVSNLAIFPSPSQELIFSMVPPILIGFPHLSIHGFRAAL